MSIGLNPNLIVYPAMIQDVGAALNASGPSENLQLAANEDAGKRRPYNRKEKPVAVPVSPEVTALQSRSQSMCGA